jgi:hypothetical protein
MSERAFNGKTGEYIRWVLGLILAGLVSYATAMGSIQQEIATVKAKQESQFGEVLRRLEIMQADIRELRSR